MPETQSAAGETGSARAKVCKAWYAAFRYRRLDALMELFDDNPRVSIGAGGTRKAVPYAGTFEGRDNVRWYYHSRFEQQSDADKAATEPLDPEREMRPFCMIEKLPCECSNWVVYCAQMEDHAGISNYKGPYLHVFGFRGDGLKIASLDMFFSP